ncbi:MAG: tRNA (adenosine(37)-N6)-threonylcarbamoyltransferase complex ATPase subunit type 1 TsaE [Flavobacteriales bacterium]|nr:tRNA (adenosine(37)-N6)-threonylcarbamoyltransferase complex ATPase subunit type 1 TsaE [Flavobacteriales bacterium]
MEFIAKNTADLDQICEKLIEQFHHKVILFYGEMGNGKTTLIKQLCKKLGVTEPTSSPTFSIVNEYKTNDNKTIYHFDFYRIKNETEVLDFGYEEYLYSNNFCFIEWPEKIPNMLPEDVVKVYITLDKDNHRVIKVN